MTRLPRPRCDERGLSLSVFLVLLLPLLLMAAGLVVDGSAQAAAKARAESVAERAARAGVDAGAGDRLLGRDGAPASVVAARSVLAAEGMDGTVSVEAGVIHITTSTTTSTTFLSIVGINQLSARGAANARLVNG